MQRIDASKLDLKDSSIVNIRRVTKVVKGGKNSRFSVTVTLSPGRGDAGYAGRSSGYRVRSICSTAYLYSCPIR